VTITVTTSHGSRWHCHRDRDGTVTVDHDRDPALAGGRAADSDGDSAVPWAAAAGH
jgi:hypothetical protein